MALELAFAAHPRPPLVLHPPADASQPEGDAPRLKKEMCLRKRNAPPPPEGDAPRLEDEGGTVRDGESEAVGRDVQAAQVDVAQLVRKRLAYSRPEAWGGR